MAEKNAIQGFTLVEMLITMAIIGILAAIAYPSYKDYIERGHITDAYAELLDINNYIKTERVRNPGAQSAASDLNTTIGRLFKEPDLTARYDIRAFTPERSSARYNLVVTPKNGSGYTLALWMNSVGEAYRCKTAAAAKAYDTSGACEKIGAARK